MSGRRAVDRPGNYDTRLRDGFAFLTPGGTDGAKVRKRRRRSRAWTRDRWLRHFLPAERMPVHAPPIAPPVYEHAIWCNGSRHFPPGEPGHSCSCRSGPTSPHRSPPRSTALPLHFDRVFEALRPVPIEDELPPLPSPPSDWISAIKAVQACRALLREAADAGGFREAPLEAGLRAASRLLYHYIERALEDGMLKATSRILIDTATKTGRRH